MTEPVSDLRKQQTRLTRDLIMDALVELILDQGVQAFSVQQVADQAGVSHRTVYRHYPSREALLEALAQWLTERFELELGQSEASLYDDIGAGIEQTFTLMDGVSRHVQAYVVLMMGTRTSAKARDARTTRLRKTVEKGPARDLDRADAKAVSAVVRALTSSMCWYQLTQQYGLDGPTAGRTVRWALETMFEELEAGGGPASAQ